MIQENELRIGNLVSVKKTALHYAGENYKSALFEIEELNKEVVHFKGFHAGEYYKDLQPIPITESILLKCGFEKIEIEEDDYYDCSYEKQLNSDVFISYSYDFSCALYRNKEKSINEPGVLPNWHSVDTVHGLQNLHFILTGQELNIEL